MVAVFLDEAAKIAIEVQAKCGSKKMKDFRLVANAHEDRAAQGKGGQVCIAVFDSGSKAGVKAVARMWRSHSK